MAVWPNGLRTPPKFSSLWKEYKGVPDSGHWGLDSYGYEYNHVIDDAQVFYIGWNTYGGGGREIWYRLRNGDVIVYYHNAVDVFVKVGDQVVEGQRLGRQSDTGKAFGIHNHTEVWVNGRRDSRVNPLTYIAALVGSSPAGGGGTPIIETEDDVAKGNIVVRDTANGSIFGLNLTTGWEFGFTSPAQLALVQGRPEFASLELPAVATDVAPTIMALLRQIAAGSRSDAVIDVAAVADAIIEGLPRGANLSIDGLKDALKEDFDAIPAKVLDELRNRL